MDSHPAGRRSRQRPRVTPGAGEEVRTAARAMDTARRAAHTDAEASARRDRDPPPPGARRPLRRPHTRAQWMTASSLLERPRLFIDGQWRDTTGPSNPVFEASSEQLLGRVTLAEGPDVDAAVSAARTALRGPWAAMDVPERCALLDG